jgi:hypothetical protein
MADYGSLPFAQQIAFLRDKTNLPTERWDDLLREAHDTAFVVAGATKADLLDDLHKAVLKGVEKGTTLQEFRADFERLVARRGWTGWTGEDTAGGRAWRTRVIYETNLRSSYAAGRWSQIQQVKADRPYLLYRHSDSVLTPRPQHVAWDGLVLPADDPWWKTHYPPNGWGCKCRVFAVDDDDLRQLGKAKPDEAPDSPIDPKTGAPDGIDEGWDYAPGASRHAELAREKAGKLAGSLREDLQEELRRNGVEVALPVVPVRPPPPPVGPGWHEPVPTDLDAVLARGRAREADLFGSSAKNMDKLADKLKGLEDDVDAKFKALFDDDSDWRTIQAHADAGAKYLKAKGSGEKAMDKVLKGMRAKVAEIESTMRDNDLMFPTAKQAADRLLIEDYGAGVARGLRNDVLEFYKQFGVKAARVAKIADRKPRAFCQPAESWDGDLVNMGDSVGNRAVLFHEFGHSMEWNTQSMTVTRDWVLRRATGPVAPLKDLTGSPFYRDDEVAYPGNFFDPYVGKDYGGATSEVVSMGLQNFTKGSDLLSFYLKDRDHFQLILGLLPL